MPLSPGTYLGTYEILAPIGGGGMGDVYKARDTRLNRTVALKILAARVVGNAEMRQRFQREAKAISNLSHPNVCVLHDIGHHDGIDYLVMEYLKGETLATRLEKGPLPPEQLLRSAIEITGALAHAHRQGILHRDLKPGNIMLTRSGAKLLDFGLARVHTPEGAGTGSLVSTVAADLTQEGTIIGTLAYMAPEQLEGMTVDARTDIFSLGAVLYEMATGRRAFEGRSSAILISAIMDRDPPPVSDVQPLAPPGFDHVVQRCLAKDRDQRWLSAHEVKLELDWISQELTRRSAIRVNRTQTDRPPFKLARGERIAWFSATAVLLIASMILTTIALRHTAPAPKTAITFNPAAPRFKFRDLRCVT
jgi:serine/threonine protein kinase